MGIMDTIFGSSGGDIPPESKIRNLDITPPEWKALRGQIANLVSKAATGKRPLNVGGVPSAPGPYAVGATDQEMALIDQLFGRREEGPEQVDIDALLSQFAQGGTELQGASQADLLKTLSGQYLSPSSNPFLQQTIETAIRPLRNEWENTIMPNLKIGFTKAGQTITGFGSSPFDRAAALAGNEYGAQVGDVATKISAANYENERNRMLQALGLAGEETGRRAGIQTAGLEAKRGEEAQNLAERQAKTQELVQTLQSVALPRLIEQYGVDVGVQEFRNRLATLMQLLQMEQGMATGTVANMQQSPPESGILGSLIGAAGAMGGAAIMASDRRLKTDITPLGAYINGVPLYEFSYRWEPSVRRWGVMADEAPERAVRVLPNGYLGVRYDLL